MHFQQKEAIFALVWKGRVHPGVSGVVFVSCSTDAEGPGHLPAVLTIHYFITMQQFVYCQQPVWNNNLQWTTTSVHPSGVFPAHTSSVFSRRNFCIILERSILFFLFYLFFFGLIYLLHYIMYFKDISFCIF